MAAAFEQSPVLCATDLTKLYGTHVGCTGVSLEIYPGEVLGIVGESGSGKSTLLNMLSGRLRPTAGSVIYCDAHGMKRSLHDLSEGYRRRLLRTELGFVHQHPRDGLRMQVRAGANISERLMAAGVRRYADLRQAAVTWLKRVEIDPARVDDRPEQYSGGMQQRLLLAAALLGDPKLLILDEPTAGLDPRERVRLRTLLADMAQDRIILVATHVVSDVESVATKVILLRAGKIVDAAPVPDLIEKHAPGGGLEDVYLNVFGEGDGK